jgi:hypothetical protein
LPWSESLIEKFKDKWNWCGEGNGLGLGQNKALKSFSWSNDFIKKYNDKWDWSGLSDIESLPWSVNLIEIFIAHDVYPHINITEVHELIKRISIPQIHDILNNVPKNYLTDENISEEDFSLGSSSDEDIPF